MNLLASIKQKLNATIKSRINSWLSKRVPGSYKHVLSSRNIFIMPTRFGFSYLLLVTLLFLLGTNYQNNIILLLSYLLASLFITTMMHSFYNFSQLTFTSTKLQYGFASQNIYFPIQVKTSKDHYDINFHFYQIEQNVDLTKLDLCSRGEVQVLVSIKPELRGVHELGRIKVFSEYSLGLFITWAMLDFSHQVIVFPHPKKLSNHSNFLSSINEKGPDELEYKTNQSGIDDFSELKNYIVGESQARVAWKQLARGQGKLTKHYQSQQGNPIWLKLSSMPHTDIETQLSYLCFLILEYGKTQQQFGLLLDSNLSSVDQENVSISPDAGNQHQQNCLIALAKFNNGRSAD